MRSVDILMKQEQTLTTDINSLHHSFLFFLLYIGLIYFMVFNTTFNHISVTQWRKPEYSEKTTVPSQVTENFITYCCIEYTLPRTGFKLTTLVVIVTDCTGGCKSNYMYITIKIMTAPYFIQYKHIYRSMGQNTGSLSYILYIRRALSTIFQLNRGCQFYWLREPDYAYG